MNQTVRSESDRTEFTSHGSDRTEFINHGSDSENWIYQPWVIQQE